MDRIKYFESPNGMFELMEEVFFRFYDDAAASDFILLVFLLYHLREQIVGGQNHKEINSMPLSQRTDGQKLFVNLWQMPQFQIIRELCNGSKHHRINKQVREIAGFTCGLSRSGDQLGQRYFLVDGEESRDLFSAVIDKYRNFFREKTHLMSSCS